MSVATAASAELDARVVAKAQQWRHLFAAAEPGSLDAYFKANELRPAGLEVEQGYLQALFMRSRLRQAHPWHSRDGLERRAQERAALERALARQVADEQARLDAQHRAALAECELQARFDAEYQARQQQQHDRAIAERELERAAGKDAAWQHCYRVIKKQTEARIAREHGHVHETFALAGGPHCTELERSDLDLLGDLEVPIVGGLINAHARRRAFFTRISSSPRPVSLAHGRRAA